MRYCNLKFGYNKAGVKSDYLQLFKTVLVRKNTPWQTKPHQNLMEHKMCLENCIVTKPQLGKVCIFLPNYTLRLFAFKIALKLYVEAPHSHCVNYFLACSQQCLAVGKKIITRVLGKIYQRYQPNCTSTE